jgi:diacylglycerol kinase
MSLPPLPRYSQKGAWKKFVASFGYAFSGLWYAIRTQRNLRIHSVIAVFALALGLILHISAIEFAVVFLVISGMFIAELFNTAIELCVDLASPEYHPLAKIAKDVAAGAVLVNATVSIIVGLCIFAPHLLALLQ